MNELDTVCKNSSAVQCGAEEAKEILAVAKEKKRKESGAASASLSHLSFLWCAYYKLSFFHNFYCYCVVRLI